MSCTDVLREYFRDEALLAAPGTTGPSVWGLDPSLPGTGLGALGFVLRHAMPVGRPIGGSGRLTDALESALRAAGGEVITGHRVEQIRTTTGRVVGITLDDGRRSTPTPSSPPATRMRPSRSSSRRPLAARGRGSSGAGATSPRPWVTRARSMRSSTSCRTRSGSPASTSPRWA